MTKNREHPSKLSKWTLKGDRLATCLFVVVGFVVLKYFGKNVKKGEHPPLNGAAFIRYFSIFWSAGLDAGFKKSGLGKMILFCS